MAVSTKYFPFVMGLDQTTDDRLLEPGRPRAIENLAIRKKGRLGMRYDYDVLPQTTQITGTLTLFDLASYEGRLLGFGQNNDPFGNGVYSPAAPQTILEYLGEPLFAWHGTDPAPDPQLSMMANIRDLGRIPRRTSIVALDVAAGNGMVGIVYELGADTFVHILDAAKDSTILAQTITGHSKPRIVCVGSGSAAKFFIGGVEGTTPKLRRFDPTVDTQLTALTDPAGAGGAITSLDMSLANEGTTFWMGYGRVGPLTRIHGFNASGTETHDFAGPAVLADFVTIFTEAQLAATVRIHLACVINGTGALNMSTYLGATSALETNTPAMFPGILGQVGICVAAPVSTTGRMLITLPSLSIIPNVQVGVAGYINNTHVVTGVSSWENALANSKLLNVRGRAFFASTTQDTIAGARTHLMACANLYAGGSRLILPQAAVDRLVASACAIGQLPNLAFDATTGKTYWGRTTLTEASVAVPVISEVDLCSTDRRQTANLGNVLYVAGGMVHAYDGRVAAEASFLTTPRVLTAAASIGAGLLTLLGVYQIVAVFETFDARGRRIQSAPSDVITVTLTGANNQILITGLSPHTLRYPRLAFSGFSPTNDVPAVVFYRTLNTANGNLTFFRDLTVTSAPQGSSTTLATMVISDAVLSTREILYTQGARGSLSGPLPFVAPEPCSSLAASADRIMSGNLPAGSRIQESRPLFVNEQVNWSDSIGFERDTRGRVLAVVRLDERRIVFTETELFELDGPGLDDNGNGDIGAPRRLPSDVGLFGGVLGWRSVVECSLGVMFQGLIDQIYLLPRGGTTPQPIGMAVQDRLVAFPTVTAAIYMAADQTVRFTCNNSGGTDSVQLLYDIVQQEWVTEGPFGVPTAAAAQFQGRLVTLQSNVVRQQRSSHPPAALIANAWRSGSIHPFGLGQEGSIKNYQFYGEYRGDCSLKCIVTYDDLTVENMIPAEVNALSIATGSNASNAFIAPAPVFATLAVGAPFSFKFTPNQMKCECVRVDFEVDVPFPVIANFASASRSTAGNTLAINLPTNRAIGDRIVLIINMSNIGALTATAAGWTARFDATIAGGSSRQTILERILDGSEASPVTFTWAGTATAATAIFWMIRNSHATAPIELSSQSFTLGTTATHPALTPSWGARNTRWLAVLCVEDRTAVSAAGNVNATPPDYKGGVSSSLSNADPNLNGQTIGGDKALNAATVAAITSSWGWVEASLSRAFSIAIRPSDTLPSEGLAYHYWAMDVEDAGKSALKSPLQMG